MHSVQHHHEHSPSPLLPHPTIQKCTPNKKHNELQRSNKRKNYNYENETNFIVFVTPTHYPVSWGQERMIQLVPSSSTF